MLEKFRGFIEKEQRRKLRFIPIQVVLAYTMAVCGPQPTEALKTFEPTRSPEQTLQLKQGIELGFPLSDDLWVINGPHFIGHDEDNPNVVKNSLDVTSHQENILCSPGERKSIKDVKVVAPLPATVIQAGGKDKNDRSDTLHSIVRLKLDNGYTLILVHLDNIEVEVGQRLIQGQDIGEMSCEVPAPYERNGKEIKPKTDLIHLHEGLEKDGELVSIVGSTLTSLQVREDGTMKNRDQYAVLNYTVTPDLRRCGPSKESIKACDGRINYIPHPKNAKPGVVKH